MLWCPGASSITRTVCDVSPCGCPSILKGKPPGLVEISIWPYLTFFFFAAYAVLEVETSANVIAIRMVTAALIRFEFGRMATTSFLRFIIRPPSWLLLVCSRAS